ncbi:hypothetical protein EA462_00945 [Natrarchaeobius halalkaliphilus]|uniref:Uncharacterized protein n=2 Tax=Natrarchaeobius halalkaliphilus TaxID=1679091 RepID=A0A3N6P9C6_9EURY|nr:hypothetical protein EA462_00945 [Natrarchaeobius halalkaliphilus]
MVPVNDGRSPAPIDRSVLERLRSQFLGSRMFQSAEIVTAGKLHLRVDLSDEYYPNEVSARLEIRWYRNDEFNVHYQEERQDSAWKCRWDRHPNVHNSRDHFHLPPTSSRSDAQNEQWPVDHRDVSRLVLNRIEERIEVLWEQQ